MKINEDIKNITQDDCYMYGIILGDGSMHNEDQNGYISLHTVNKKHILDFCISWKHLNTMSWSNIYISGKNI